MNIVIFILLPSIVFVSLLIFIRACKQYYGYMKKAHKEITKQLMCKDPMIQAAGEWIRWPVGSIQFLLSVLDATEYYGDKSVYYYKVKARIYGTIFIILFVTTMTIVVYLGKLL